MGATLSEAAPAHALGVASGARFVLGVIAGVGLALGVEILVQAVFVLLGVLEVASAPGGVNWPLLAVEILLPLCFVAAAALSAVVGARIARRRLAGVLASLASAVPVGGLLAIAFWTPFGPQGAPAWVTATLLILSVVLYGVIGYVAARFATAAIAPAHAVVRPTRAST